MKVAANGVDLFFDLEGTKLVAEGPWMRERPTVILLHTGPGADHSLYKGHVGPALAEVAQVVYLDLRGAGRSDWSSPEHWTLDTWVEDLAAFCDALELERPSLLGTGVGGIIALLQAARRPERVDRLVLVSTVARSVHTRSIAVLDRLGGPEVGEVAARFFADPTELHLAEFLRICVPYYTRDPVSADAVARMRMNLALAATWERTEARDFDATAEAARVRCPVLVLAGEDDPASTVEGVEELVAALPAELVRYERFAEAGHGVFRDQPAAIAPVQEFLAASAPEPA
jgi:pimeloyl-ACP methyl ester carboxylesterase